MVKKSKTSISISIDLKNKIDKYKGALSYDEFINKLITLYELMLEVIEKQDLDTLLSIEDDRLRKEVFLQVLNSLTDLKIVNICRWIFEMKENTWIDVIRSKY